MKILGRHYRSWRWRGVRKKFLLKEPTCQACAADKDLDVHHIFPFHLFPALELVDTNLITLCRHCHFTYGHNRDWDLFNPNIREDAFSVLHHTARMKHALDLGILN